MVDGEHRFLDEPECVFEAHRGQVYACRIRFRTGRGPNAIPVKGAVSGYGVGSDGLPIRIDLFAWELRAVAGISDAVVRRWTEVEEREGPLDARRALTRPRLERILAAVSKGVAGLSAWKQIDLGVAAR